MRRAWLIALCGALLAGTAPGEAPRPSVLLSIMQEQLQRSMAALKAKADPPPYFLSYDVTETQNVDIGATNGALTTSRAGRHRALDVDVRVGSYDLDSSHEMGRDPFAMMAEFRMNATAVPLEDDPAALRSVFWRVTDDHYRLAAQKLTRIKTDTAVQVKPEDPAADFSQEAPHVYVADPVAFKVDTRAWEQKVRAWSSGFKTYPDLEHSSVTLTVNATNHYLVNSEGTSTQFGLLHARIAIAAVAQTDDGTMVTRYRTFDTTVVDKLPDDATMTHAVQDLAGEVEALRRAPVMEPYTGPAILSGRAAGVFFHEIFGHRIEGHRQKNEHEGQTFTHRINEAVLPEYISVVDDPTLHAIGSIDLNGYYPFDDEGVPATPVQVVDHGVLKAFLMSRSPIAGFRLSNGHGRKQTGLKPVGRQGNLVVSSSKTVPEAKLRDMLRDECRRQGKPYGLYIADIEGGFTMTERSMPQAYEVIPTLVYRVYLDGRPDELVRGVDVIGTPLISFSKIAACGDTPDVFNGYCGAESGFVPVAAVAPPMLISQIELQKREKGTERPPLLPPP